MKIVFLDVDGVLNCASTKDRFNGYIGLCKNMIALFEDIISKTGACWVLSSTWRINHEHVSYLFRNLNDDTLNKYEDKTPNLCTNIRGEEIQAWIDNHKPDDFIILDDVSNMAHLTDKLIKTNFDIGLTREIADRCIAILNGLSDPKPQLTGHL